MTTLAELQRQAEELAHRAGAFRLRASSLRGHASALIDDAERYEVAANDCALRAAAIRHRLAEEEFGNG